MEEKVNDKDILTALKQASEGFGSGYIGDLYKDTLELIHRLQGELKKELAEHESFTKQTKSEIERLTEENEYLDIVAKQALADYQNAQVQVDELKERAEIAENIANTYQSESTSKCWVDYAVKKAVEDTAKDILQRIMNIIKKSDGFLAEEVIRIMAKQNGVEVE